MSIEKSPLVRQQEEKIAELQVQIKRKNTVIKSLKTRLSNTQERVEEVQRKAHQSFSKVQEVLLKKTKALRALIAKLVKDKRFSKTDREQLQELLGTIDQGMPDDDQIPGFEEPDADFADEKARNNDPFAEFKVAPEDDQQKDLRKLYLQLSKRFHPDRAKDDTEKQLYHEIQQRVIQAYQAHDLQAMVRLAMEHDLSLLDTAESDTDVMEQRIQFLTRQLEGLEQQQERLSAEIKNLRQSDMGEMLTEVDSFARMGMDITSAESTMGPAMQQIDILINILEEVDRTGNINLIEELFASPYGDHYDPYGDDDDDFFGEMMNFFEPEVEQNPNPRFPIFSWVTFLLKIPQKRKPIEVKGRVLSATLLPGGVPVYAIEVDADALAQLPKEIIEDMVETGQIGVVTDIAEKVLKPAAPPSEAKLKARVQALKDAWYRYAFSHLSSVQRERIIGVLDADIEKSGPESWLTYLNEKIKFPFSAILEVEDEEAAYYGREETIKIKLQVLRIFLDPMTYSIMAEAKDANQVTDACELIELYSKSPKVKQILEDYEEWYYAFEELTGSSFEF